MVPEVSELDIASLPSLGNLVLGGNATENWYKWLQVYQVYFISKDSRWKEQLQRALFLHFASKEAREIYNKI